VQSLFEQTRTGWKWWSTAQDSSNVGLITDMARDQFSDGIRMSGLTGGIHRRQHAGRPPFAPARDGFDQLHQRRQPAAGMSALLRGPRQACPILTQVAALEIGRGAPRQCRRSTRGSCTSGSTAPAASIPRGRGIIENTAARRSGHARGQHRQRRALPVFARVVVADRRGARPQRRGHHLKAISRHPRPR